jgi:hypothetical protein
MYNKKKGSVATALGSNCNPDDNTAENPAKGLN